MARTVPYALAYDRSTTINSLEDSKRFHYFPDNGEPATGPQIYLVRVAPANAVINPHFHGVDQFQVFVEGSGYLGRHELLPLAVQYADAHTTYGPINGGSHGIAFFTVRAERDMLGAKFMPGSKAERVHHPPRHRQLIGHANLIEQTHRRMQASTQVATELFSAPDGVRATVLSANSGIALRGPDPALSRAQIWIVVDGAMEDGAGTVADSFSCVSVRHGEDAPAFLAGPAGASVLVLEFSRVLPRSSA